MTVEVSAMARRTLRRLELEAYATVVSAFRAQGPLHKEKKSALALLSKHLGISNERHRAEIRRAVNDDLLSAVAGCISGQETDKLWRKEGQKIASTNPRFVSRQVSHLPQVVSSAAATAALGSQAGIKSEPDLKKHTSSRVQNALKFIISQNPSSRSQSSTPIKPPPAKQPSTPTKNSSPTPAKPGDSLRQSSPVKTVGKASSQVESVGTQTTVVDVRTVATSTLRSPAEKKKTTDKSEPVKRKPTSKLESLLCDEPFTSPVKQEGSTTSKDSTSDQPQPTASTTKAPTPSSSPKQATSSPPSQPAASPVPEKTVDDKASLPADPVEKANTLPELSTTPATAAEQDATEEMDNDVTKTDDDGSSDQEMVVGSDKEVPASTDSKAAESVKEEDPSPLPLEPSASPTKAESPATTPRIGKKRSIASLSPPPAKRVLLSPPPPLITEPISPPSDGASPTLLSPSQPLPIAPPLSPPVQSPVVAPAAANTLSLASPELKHKPHPLSPLVKESSEIVSSEMNLNLLLKQAESPVSTPVLPSISTPLSLQSPVLHTPSTPGIIIEDQTDSLIQAICSDMSALEESVAISELADQLGLEPSQLSIPDFMHLIQPGIGTMESNSATTDTEMEPSPAIEQPPSTGGTIPSAQQTTEISSSDKPSTLPLAQPLPPAPLLESIFTPSEELVTPMSLLTPAEDLAAGATVLGGLLPDSAAAAAAGAMAVDLDSLVGEGEELLEGIPEDIAETIHALVRLDEQANAPWKQ